ncbi:MAG: hypothetical protein A2X86_03860 [Bdellovibrionales bacterium GWA2_49_15]|nr:MAG: hypothetical protein A2X86_03860 [Bdellovibrionales bacterium GWA2_49_15]HAZ12352.1 hypothetical protein [Bdellovibrionales bacterium]
MPKSDYRNKYQEHLSRLPVATALSEKDLQLLQNYALQFRPTFQELKTLHGIFVDFKMWGQTLVTSESFSSKDSMLSYFKGIHQQFIKEGRAYTQEALRTEKQPVFTYKPLPPEDKIMGTCPVASEKTLCCNLLTLDAARNCAFDCSYCSIRSFYPDNDVFIENNLAEKLSQLQLDPTKTYHIGTGQSSDSLIWGNRANILDALVDFARKNPNVILEFKSKSNNIDYFLNRQIPRNILFTWSLNPDIIIKNEEPMTSSLAARLKAAQQISAKGNLVGFHFHPLFIYEGHEVDYRNLIGQLTSLFTPEQVATISMGTLTFTKKTMRLIRKRNIQSKVLQMELEEIAGKYSHTSEIKAGLFNTIYQMFQPWHGKVFFYLCMEEKSIWDKVFRFSYANNDDFDRAMKAAYAGKIQSLP